MSIRPAIEEIVNVLILAGLDATDDAGAFYPSPIGCLVGVPSLKSRGLATNTAEVPVHVVSSSPLDAKLRDELFDTALRAADALGVTEFDLSGFGGNVNQSDLPAYLLTVTVTYPRSN